MEYYILDRNTEMDWRHLSSASIRENQTLTADRGECLPFQILIYHSGEPVTLKEVRFGALKGENAACDLEGHGVPVLEHCDCKGRFTRRSLKIDGNTVVWAYVRIPETMEPGAYLLPISLLAEDMPEQTLQVPIEVSHCCVENHGVNDNDRMSRIQWFNSSLGIDDRIPQPFIPPEWDGGKRKVRLLEHETKQGMYQKKFKRFYSKEWLDYVMVDESGFLITPDYITSAFKHMLEVNGLRQIRFHDLRHTCATLMQMNDR